MVSLLNFSDSEYYMETRIDNFRYEIVLSGLDWQFFKDLIDTIFNIVYSKKTGLRTRYWFFVCLFAYIFSYFFKTLSKNLGLKISKK